MKCEQRRDRFWYPSAPRATPAVAFGAADTQRVLRNTYALLAMTPLFSGAMASARVAFGLPGPGLPLSLAGMFGLLFLVHRLQSSAWALAAVFALTGSWGTRSRLRSHPSSACRAAVAPSRSRCRRGSSARGAISAPRQFPVRRPRRRVIAGIAAALFALPVLGGVVAAGVALIATGLLMYETSRIVHGGESNYLLATVGLYASIFNLSAGLLTLSDVGGSEA